jgi:hypothetical protein
MARAHRAVTSLPARVDCGVPAEETQGLVPFIISSVVQRQKHPTPRQNFSIAFRTARDPLSTSPGMLEGWRFGVEQLLLGGRLSRR